MNKIYFLLCSILCVHVVLIRGLDPFDDPHFKKDRNTIVNLFEWQFEEIGKECERYLGPKGYGGVLTSPVWEHELMENPVVNNRYGLVSYKIMTRYGDGAQLAGMIRRCSKAGVRVHVDCNVGSTTFPYIGKGFGGTPFDGTNQSYPGIPYTRENFNSFPACPTESDDIEDPTDPIQLRNCMVTGLNDLDNGQEYVQHKIAQALNKLIGLGIAGIRVDASYMSWPKHLDKIFNKLDNLNSKYFEPNSKLFIFHSIDYEDGLPPGPGPSPDEYLDIGSVISVDTRRKVVNSFLKDNTARIENLHTLNEKSQIPSDSAVSFVYAPAYQFTDVPEGINFRQPFLLVKATAFLLAWPYGTPLVMSSYNYTVGPAPDFWKLNSQAKKWPAAKAPVGPSGYSVDVTIKADSSCSEPWICEHRWKPISNMVKFRNVVSGTPVENWIGLGENVIAFSRGSKGFILIVNDNTLVDHVFHTGLPGGQYCDIISGEMIGDIEKLCSGREILVENDGRAHILLDGSFDEEGVIAFHIGSRLPH